MAESRDTDAGSANLGRGFIAWFARNQVAASLLLLLLCASGLIVSARLSLETFPRYDPRLIRVEVPYPGATPSEVEEDIVKRIEDSLLGTIGIDRTVSASQEGLAVVDAKMAPLADDVDTLNSVRTAIERIEDFPPGDADQPEVTKLEVSPSALTIALSSNFLDQYELHRAAESLRGSLLLLPGVSTVRLFGTDDKEMRIEISEETLRQYNLSLDDIVGIIRKTSVNVTGGELRIRSGNIVMSTLAKRDQAAGFEDIMVRARADGSFVRLGDIARIREGLLDDDTFARVNGVPTVFLQVKVSAYASPQQASSRIRDHLAIHEAPQTVQLAIWEDEARAVEDRIYLVVKNGILGLILVFAALLLLFDLRMATWVAAGLPVVFLGSLAAFPVFGLTLNVVTVFAFFLLIGIVIEHSIVVGESVAAFRDRGHGGVHGEVHGGTMASIAGTRAVVGPITVGTLATVAAFAALLPLDGPVGQMLAVIPVVAILGLLLSLFEASLLLPGRLATTRPWSAWPLSEIRERFSASLQRTIESRIVPLIAWSVHRRRWPPLIVTGGVLAAACLVIFDVVAYDPSLRVADEKNIQVDLVLPDNAQPENMLRATAFAVEAAERVNDGLGGTAINATAVTIGRHIPMATYGSAEAAQSRGNLASVQLRLNPPSARSATVDEVKRRWQRSLVDIPGVKSVIYPARQIQSSDILSHELIHPRVETLQSAAADFRDALSNLDGVGHVGNSMEAGKRRFDVRVNTAGHAAGLTAADVATQLRHSFYGAEAQRIQRGREEFAVLVRYPKDRRTGYAELLNERIALPGGGEQVPLYTIAEITESRSMANRLRIDGVSAAVVTAYLDTGAAFSGSLLDEVASNILPGLQIRYPGIQVRSHGVNREVQRISDTLYLSVPIAVLVIYFLVASFLRSFVQPLLVLAGVPMAFVGAVAGHLVLGFEFSHASIFGLIAVTGVAISDTVLLVHRYNGIRRESEIQEIAAISEASLQRARAIVLTSAATVLGVAPFLFSGNEAIQFLVPLAVSIAFGSIFAGAGLLFLLPSVIMLFEVAKSRLERPAIAI